MDEDEKKVMDEIVKEEIYFVIADPPVVKYNSPTVVYEDIFPAMAEAERLCRKEKGRFYVAKVVMYCELNDVKWKYIERSNQ